MKGSQNTCLLTCKSSPHPGCGLRSAHTARAPGPAWSSLPLGPRVLPLGSHNSPISWRRGLGPPLSEHRLSAGLERGSLATQSSGFSPPLSLSRAAGPPSWGGLDLLPRAPPELCPGAPPRVQLGEGQRTEWL